MAIKLGPNPFRDDEDDDRTATIRKLRTLQPLTTYREINLEKLDAPMLSLFGSKIRDDARARMRSSGELFEMHHRDDTGRRITEFEGDFGAFIAPFTLPPALIRINKFPDEVERTMRVPIGARVQFVDGNGKIIGGE